MGDVTQKLRARMADVVRGRDARRREWCVPVFRDGR
jgi:hypothetical protein